MRAKTTLSVLLCGLILSGCVDLAAPRPADAASASPAVEALDTALAEVAAQRDSLAAQAATMPAGKSRTALEKAAAAASAVAAGMEKAREVAAAAPAELDKNLQAQPQDALGVTEAIGRTAAGLAPQPIAAYIALATAGVGLVGALLRNRQNARGKEQAEERARAQAAHKERYLREAEQAETTGRRIVAAIETAKRDGKVDFTDPDTRKILNNVMGSAAQILVDSEQRRLALAVRPHKADAVYRPAPAQPTSQ